MKHTLLLFLLFFSLSLSAQNRRFRIMEYNVENLFDTIHAPGKQDVDFTPQGKYRWTSNLYHAKLGKLARAIVAVGGTLPPDVIVLCEVENDSVIRDLCRHTSLCRLGYEYIVTHSADRRGINVAVLYQPMAFRPFETDTLRIAYYPTTEKPTRDVLRVSGRVASGDTLDIMAVHWPSRAGGQEKTESYRIRTAQRIRAAADSLIQHRLRPALVITGDCNDEFHNRSLSEGLRALLPQPPFADMSLYILSANLRGPEDIRGTYKFRGEWNQLDQFVVNGALLRTAEGLRTTPSACRIVHFPFLTEPDSSGGLKPRYTFVGPHYHGGTSDHLPLLLDLYE